MTHDADSTAFAGGKTIWFGRGQPDTQYLDSWRDAPLTYHPGDEDSTWKHDHHEFVIAHDSSGAVFARARAMLLRGEFYPPQVMQTVSDAERERRLIREGDHIVLRIRGVWLGRWTLVEALAMNVFTRVIDQPRTVGYSYTTTAAHLEIGLWSAWVTWQEDDHVTLTLDAISRGAAQMPFPLLARRLQKRAHRLGIDYFIRHARGG